MIRKNHLFVASASILAFVIGVSTATAQDEGCYTIESIKGSYSLINNYAGSTAIAIGVRGMDGRGNMTGNFIINQPTPGSTTGERTITPGTQKGTYTVNCDGTGVIDRTTTAANGTVQHAYDDFVILESILIDGKLLATSMIDVARAGAVFVTGAPAPVRTWTLRNRLQQLESLNGIQADSAKIKAGLNALGNRLLGVTWTDIP